MFALTGNILLYRTVVFLGALASLVADRCTVPAVDYILVVLCGIPVRVAFKALCDLAISVEDLIVVELTTK